MRKPYSHQLDDLEIAEIINQSIREAFDTIKRNQI